MDQDACFVARVVGAAPDEVEWSWGDGAPELAGLEACHRYPHVGGRVLGVRVRRGERSAEATASLNVVFEPRDPAPTRSSPIDASEDRVFVVNPDSDTVAVLSTDPFALIEERATGGWPRTLARTDGVLAVACQRDGALRLSVEESGAPIATVDFGPGTEPYGVVADPRGGAFFVTLRGVGEVASVATSGELLDRARVGPEPRGIAATSREMGGETETTLVVSRWRATQNGAKRLHRRRDGPRETRPARGDLARSGDRS